MVRILTPTCEFELEAQDAAKSTHSSTEPDYEVVRDKSVLHNNQFKVVVVGDTGVGKPAFFKDLSKTSSY